MDDTLRQTQLFKLTESSHELSSGHKRQKPLKTNHADHPKYIEKRRALEWLLFAQMQRLDGPYRLWDESQE